MSRRRMKKLAEKAKYFWQDESAVGVVEVILILVVLITLVLLFKTQITDLLNNILSEITRKTQAVY